MSSQQSQKSNIHKRNVPCWYDTGRIGRVHSRVDRKQVRRKIERDYKKEAMEYLAGSDEL